jgi:hypothetical protein
VGLSKSQIATGHPVILVRKNRGLHFCVDYRKLNDVIRKDCFQLSLTDSTLDMLAGAKWFFTLDLKNGYWQVNLHLDDKEKTVFLTGQGAMAVQSCPLASATLL